MKRVALITGASSGIGMATANMLAKKGYTVYGTSRKERENTEFITYLQLDVTDDASVKACVGKILEKEERLDVLVNNAGNAIVGPLEKTSVEDIHKQMDTNLYGVHRMVLECLESLKRTDGYIVNIGSFGGRLALPFQTLYSMSKSAVAFYSDGLRMELSNTGVKVSLIEPGDTKTNFDSGRIPAKNYNPDVDKAAARSIEIMRESESKGVSPDKVAKVVVKIVGKKKPKPRYTTGIDAKIFGTLLRLLPYKTQEFVIKLMYEVNRPI